MEEKDSEPMTRVQPPERAVFVTDDDRRARRLRRGAIAATLFSCLWVVGLGVGMMGFGSLPGIPFLKGDQKSSDRSEGERPPVARQDLASARQSQSSRAPAQPVAARSRARARGAGRPASRLAGRPAKVGTTVSARPARGPVNPAGRQRGWARKRVPAPAPPGQLRKKAPPPPPAPRGRRRGQTTTTTTTVGVPPGQAKKTPPPPPGG